MLTALELFAKGKERRTLDTYASYGKNLENFMQDRNLTLESLKPIDIKAFIYEAGTNEKGEFVMNTAASYKRYMAALMRFIGRTDLVEYVKLNMREIKHENKFAVDLTLDEILKFIDVTKQPQLKFAWSIMAFNDLRPGEALGLHYSDIDIEAKTVRLVRHEGERYFPKGMKVDQPAVTIPLNDFTTAIFKQLPYKASERIVPVSYKTLRKWFRRYMAQAEITRDYPLTPHKLRHFFGHFWRWNKGDIQILKKVMRHSDIRYTLLYTEPSEAETTQEFREVMQF